jgi:uncharacterized membrane protein YfcA
MDPATVVGLVVLGLTAGTLASTLGVGGGIIYIPALVALFGFSQIEAQGTSLAIILPTAILSTIVHARAKRIVWKVAVLVGIIGVPFAILGAKTALAMDQDLLQRVFAVVLAMVAVRMGYRAWKLLPRGESPVVDRG